MINKNIKTKKKILEQTEALIQLSNKNIELLNQQYQILRMNFSEVIKNNRVPFLSTLSYESLTKINKTYEIEYEKMHNIRVETIKGFEQIGIKGSFNSYYESILDAFENVNNKLDKRIKLYKNLDKNELYFFKANSKLMYRFDPKIGKAENFTVNSIDNQGYLSCICKIDESNIFIYGGYRNANLDSSYIVNTSSLSVNVLPPGIKVSGTSGQLCCKKIYIFGGQTSKPH